MMEEDIKENSGMIFALDGEYSLTQTIVDMKDGG